METTGRQPCGSGARFALLALCLVSCAGGQRPEAGRLGPSSPPDSVAASSPCFHDPSPWTEPEEVHLAQPVRRYNLFGILQWQGDRISTIDSARDEMQRRFGIDSLEVERAEIRLRKEYGRRLTLLTTTGLGSSAEDALEAEYQLWRGFNLRSETRERGETFMELRREFMFR